MIITAYIPLSKNAGIKLTAIFALESVLYLAFHDILYRFSFILQWWMVSQ
jgi:hypothetical protein